MGPSKFVPRATGAPQSNNGGTPYRSVVPDGFPGPYKAGNQSQVNAFWRYVNKGGELPPNQVPRWHVDESRAKQLQQATKNVAEMEAAATAAASAKNRMFLKRGAGAGIGMGALGLLEAMQDPPLAVEPDAYPTKGYGAPPMEDARKRDALMTQAQIGGGTPARKFVPRGTIPARGNTGVGETPEQLDAMMIDRWLQEQQAQPKRTYQRMATPVRGERPPQDTVNDRMLEREFIKRQGY